MKIQRFEDLQAWQQARVLANMVYDATEQGKFARDYKLRDQICVAAGSVMHNCAEGFDSGFDNEFAYSSNMPDDLPVKFNPKFISRLTVNMLRNRLSNKSTTKPLKQKR